MKKIFLICSLLFLDVCFVNAQWKLPGNTGTNPNINFLGTTDAKPLVFRVFNRKSGYIDFEELKANTSFGYLALLSNTIGAGNSAFGYNALLKNSTGNFNTAFGNTALDSNTTGSSNTAIGSGVLSYNKTGNYNTAAGQNALSVNRTGSYNTVTGFWAAVNDTGSYNTATGSLALFHNFSSTGNSAFGYNSLGNGQKGNYNTALGMKALYSNSADGNTATGYQSLYSTTTGTSNTATGSNALYSNTIGSYNTAAGVSALYKNISGSFNVAAGFQSMYNNNSGNSNTAYGNQSLLSNTVGSYNTAIGYKADVNAKDLQNATAIGYNAIATANNQVMLGNTSITSVKAAGSFVIYSDGRFKKNIKENVPGLAFINQLRPVTYNYDIHALDKFIGADDIKKDELPNTTSEAAIISKEKKVYTGFVAQEVEKIADKMGYDFSGLYRPQNNKDPYGLSYADFVVPLVKAVQELSQENDVHKKNNEILKSEINEINQQLSVIDKKLQGMSVQTQSNLSEIENPVDVKLEQNAPNPFTNTTIIKYAIPVSAVSSSIVINDSKGNLIKAIPLTAKGTGQVVVSADSFSSGIYFYSLMIDGIKVASKQMAAAK
jgi:hypothetical protein